MTFKRLTFLCITFCFIYFLKGFSLEKPDLDFYGFIKAEVLATNRINKFASGNQPDIFPVGVPYDKEKRFRHSESIWDARNSRVGVQITEKVYDVDMKGVIAIDFATDD